MAGVCLEGFDLYSATSQINGRGSIGAGGFSLVTGLQGSGRALRLETSGFATRTCVITFKNDISTGRCVLHLRFRAGDLPDSNQEIFRIRTAGGSTVLNCVITTGGTLQVRRSTTTLLSVVGAFVADVVAHFQIDMTIHSSAGAIEVKKDNVSVGSVTGQNTQGAAGDIHDFVFLSGLDSSGATFELDDLYVDDAAMRGQVDVKYYEVDEDVSSVGFTPSTGGSVEAVLDEVPGSESDYVSTSADGDNAVLGITPALGAINPLAVQPFVLARVEAASTSQIVQTLHSGASDDGGSAHTLTTSLRAYQGAISNVDPDTGNPWSPGDLDSAELELAHSVP